MHDVYCNLHASLEMLNIAHQEYTTYGNMTKRTRAHQRQHGTTIGVAASFLFMISTLCVYMHNNNINYFAFFSTSTMYYYMHFVMSTIEYNDQLGGEFYTQQNSQDMTTLSTGRL